MVARICIDDGNAERAAEAVHRSPEGADGATQTLEKHLRSVGCLSAPHAAKLNLATVGEVLGLRAVGGCVQVDFMKHSATISIIAGQSGAKRAGRIPLSGRLKFMSTGMTTVARRTCFAAILVLAAMDAKAQDQTYRSYTRQSQAIERNANAGTAQALSAINRAIAKDDASSRTLTRNYVQQNYPRLRQQYYASGSYRVMSFDQFANRELMSHATIRPNINALTNAEAAHKAQVDRFNGMQNAARTRSEAGESLIHNQQRASDAQINTVERSTQGSIRGNSAYTNPTSGNSQWMPTNSPGYHQASDGTKYFQDQNGRYFQQQGSSWVPMDPSRR